MRSRFGTFSLLILTILHERAHSGGSTEYYLTFCHKFFDIFDSSMRYQGSSCFLDLPVTWNEARTICEANNMYLLKILNTAVQNSIFNSSATLYGSRPLRNVWVNTRKEADNVWWSYEGSYAYRLLAAARLSWASAEARNFGACMTVSNLIGPFRVSSSDCNAKNSFVCSFNRTVF